MVYVVRTFFRKTVVEPYGLTKRKQFMKPNYFVRAGRGSSKMVSARGAKY